MPRSLLPGRTVWQVGLAASVLLGFGMPASCTPKGRSQSGAASGGAPAPAAAPAPVGSDPTAVAANAAPPALTGSVAGIPAERRVDWRPGIPGGIPARTTICNTVDAARFGDGKTDATAAIQAAIDKCALDQVVVLPAGTYRLTDTLTLKKSITLRGAGPAATKLVLDNAKAARAILIGGFEADSPPKTAVTGGFNKGSTQLTVASTTGFNVGDLVLIDQYDDPSVIVTGDCTDIAKRSDSSGSRSVGQLAEVVAKTDSSVTLSSPLHYEYSLRFKPELVVWNGSSGRVKNVGVEDLYITRKQNYPDEYPYSQFLLIRHASEVWVKNLETEKVTGRHIDLDSCYRCEVRDSYIHRAFAYRPGGYAYGVMLETHTSDTLVENNVVHYLDLPVVLSNSGGGNVIGYNYVDDALISTMKNGAYTDGTSPDQISGWQMPDIATHCSFPHMELFEGNWVANFQLDDVHGGSGYITFFRNFASGRHAPPLKDTQNISAFALWYGNYYANIVGNVAWNQGAPGEYEGACDLDTPMVFRLGPSSGSCDVDGRVATTLFRHGNFDFLRNQVEWAPGKERALPASLYLKQKPAFFADQRFPFVDVEAEKKLGTLPAKARFDARNKK